MIRRLLRLCAAVIAAGWAADPLSALQVNGAEYLDLHTVAARLGMRAEWREKGETLELQSQWTRTAFTRDAREYTLNGTRIMLGQPVAEQRGRLLLAGSDYRHALQPILTPQVFGAPPPVRLIVIDPGHGGADPGAENAAIGLREKALTLDLARRVRTRLEAGGFSVRLTRDDDRFIPLEERAAFAESAGADLFLSLHFNASTKPDVAGVETYAFTPLMQPSTARSRLHASDRQRYPGNRNDAWNTLVGYYIQRALHARLGAADRGLKRARFTVLRDLAVPGVLIEAGFVSHPREGRDIGSAAYRDRIADAIVEGVQTYARTAARLQPAVR
jgi:N-acetylmuramoyl-L-alanine amidase